VRDIDLNNLKIKFSKREFSLKTTSILFLVPAFAFIAFSVYIPAIWNFILSFQEWDGFQKRNWIFFDNYIRAVQDPMFLKCTFNSVFLGLVVTIFAVVLGIALAAMIYKLGIVEGAINRLIIFMPVMLPMAIVSLLFSFIYNPEMGLLNQILNTIGLGSLSNAWLENLNTIMWCIAIVGIWKIVGLTMILCFAAMQMIPQSLLESSKIDGAGSILQFFRIIMPLIKPVIKLSVVFNIVMNFKSYDLVYVLTGGGPGSVSKIVPIYMIDSAFTFNEFGYSSSLGFLLTVVVMIIIFFFNRVLKGEQYEY
jgi:raffinose/stachyose/melibiose transport system permease protein